MLVTQTLAADGHAPGVALGRALLQQGRPRLAVERFRSALEAEPGSGPARLGLARALQATGRCEESLGLLADLRAEGSWTAPAALAEARCQEQRGELSGAIVAYEEARSLGGTVALELALARVKVGDEGDAPAWTSYPDPAVIEALWTASVALRTDRDPDPEIDLLERVATGGASSVAGLLDGLRWLSLDDPHAAVGALAEASRRDPRDPRIVLWYAEALRRCGRLVDAELQLQRPAVALAGRSALGDAVAARVAHDAGRSIKPLDVRSTDPQLIASRWYLTRSASLAQAWAAAPGLGGELALLVPVSAR